MISKLPKWIEYGAFLLALVAGCINTIGLLSFEHQAVSHLTGTASLLGVNLLAGSSLIFHLLGILLCFFLGAAFTGFLLHGKTLLLGRHYDTALLVEAVLIFLAFYLLSNNSFWGHFLASAAMGLQNALATTYSGAIVRTTHLTGIFTDLGIMFGAVIRGDSFDTRKAFLFFLIIAGFVSGSALGAFSFNALGYQALLLPALICLLLSATYRVYYRSRGHQGNK